MTVVIDYRKWVGHSIDAIDALQLGFGHPVLLAHPFLLTSGSRVFQPGI